MSSAVPERPARSQRLLLRSYRSEAGVQSLADMLGWSKVAERPASGQQPKRVTWEIVPGIFLSYLEDNVIKASYIVVTSSYSPGEVNKFFLLVSDNLDGLDVDELTARAAEATTADDRARAVICAGLGAPKTVDPRILSVISDAAPDPKDSVREAVVVAASYAEWPELRPVLRKISSNDRKGSIRKLATKLIDAFDQLGIDDL